MSDALPFWKVKSLNEMTAKEWESLCDGCAKCCLVKLEDADTGQIAETRLHCKLLDEKTCRCKDYQGRLDYKDIACNQLTADNIASFTWLPETCAYRLVSEGKPLFDWHPLISGDPHSVHKANISIMGQTRSEEDIPVEELEDYVTKWV